MSSAGHLTAGIRPPGIAAPARDRIGERRPRVLIVINDAGFFLTHFVALARGAAARGADVEIAVPPSEAVERVCELGFVVHLIALDRRGMNPAADLRLLRELRMLYRRRRPDIVHHVTLKPVLYGTVAARATRVPRVVNSVTGLGYLFVSAGRRRAPLRAAVRALYRASFANEAVRVLFENPDDQALFVRLGIVPQTRTRVVRGAGVDIDAFAPRDLPGGPPLVVLPARMLWDKGVGEFVTAAGRLRASGCDARFALVGGTDVNRASVPREQLLEWARDGGVEWWGRRDDMPAVLAQAAVVVLPSYREGCPKALLEAAACGRPIVTSDVPGCREVVTHGDNGLLVPARDATALADALGQLLADWSLREQMGRRGRARAEQQFAVPLVVGEMLAEYVPFLTASSLA